MEEERKDTVGGDEEEEGANGSEIVLVSCDDGVRESQRNMQARSSCGLFKKLYIYVYIYIYIYI